MANYSLIKELCKEKGVTLKQLANTINLSETGLQKIIKGATTKVKTLEDIAAALGVPVSEFFKSDPNAKIYFDKSDRKQIEEQIISNGLEKYRNEILSDLNFIATDIKGRFIDIDREYSSVSKEHLINLVFIKSLMKFGHNKELDHMRKYLDEKEQIIEDKQQIIEFINEKVKVLKEQVSAKS